MINWHWDITPDTPLAFVDFETASKVNLREVGSHCYVRDRSTRLLSAVWKTPSGTVTWCPGLTHSLPDVLTSSAVPREVEELASSHVWIAHNAEGFDAMLWERLYPEVTPRWADSMHLCRIAGIPASLDGAAKKFGLPGKDAEGAKVMQMMTKRPDAVGTIPLWSKLLHYNAQDVEQLASVWERLTVAVPQEVLALHSAINERGVKVDRAFAESLHRVWIETKCAARDEIAEATGGKLTREKASSGPAVHAWLKSVGVSVSSLRRDYLATILDDPESLCAGDDETASLVAHVLKLRADVVRAGEGKVSRLIETLDDDDRLRRMFVFHGATTGRFSSRVVQVHNLPRGVDGVDVESLTATPLTREAVTQAAKGHSVSDVLASLVRPCFIAESGKQLCIADFASIEARCVAWMAGEDSLLRIFSSGGDVYCDMASRLYGREITKKDKSQRQVGKTTVLGCIAKGTPILTNNGWKPIETVSISDEVWDGVQWVKHDGVIDKGEKEVINVNGVWMTPDHRILTSEGWIEAWQVQSNTHQSPLVDVLENGRLLLRGRISAGVNAHAVQNQQHISQTSTEDCQLDVTYAQRKRRRQLSEKITSTLMCVRAPHFGSVFSTEFHLSSLDVATLVTEVSDTTEREVSAYIRSGSKTVPSFLGTSCHCPVTTSRRLRLIESTTTEITSLETFDSLRDPSKCTTVAKTYDILNAGPNNRFQAGLLIAHNCGYQMGHANFARVCNTQRINLEAAGVTAEQCVKAYREFYPRIPAMWKGLNDAAFATVQSGGVTELCRVKFSMRGLDLVMTLPSGRDLIYRDARIVTKIPRWAILTNQMHVPPRPCLEYTHPHGYAKDLYGGILTENASQAICRDLMVESALRYDAKRPGELVLHVHDELVAESAEPEVAIHELCREMSVAPAWAAGFPIEVEGFTSPRYVKSPFSGSTVAHYRGGVAV